MFNIKYNCLYLIAIREIIEKCADNKEQYLKPFNCVQTNV